MATHENLTQGGGARGGLGLVHTGRVVRSVPVPASSLVTHDAQQDATRDATRATEARRAQSAAPPDRGTRLT